MFEAVYRGGQSAATLITMLARDKPYDYVVTFEEIAGQLGIGADEFVRIRSGVARAKPVLLRDHKKALEAVPLKGYRVVRPGENARLATGHRRKSDRSIKRAIATVRHANEDDMTEAERERNRKVGMALSLLHERQLETEQRVARLEELMLGKRKPSIIPGSIITPMAIEAGGNGDGDEPDQPARQ